MTPEMLEALTPIVGTVCLTVIGLAVLYLVLRG